MLRVFVFLRGRYSRRHPELDEVQLVRLSINGVLDGVEVLDACFSDAVLAPFLVHSYQLFPILVVP